MNKNCRDILSSKENRNSLRKNFCPFIRYLEETDPDLKNITSYMRKMEAYLFKILKVESRLNRIFENEVKIICQP